MARPPRDRFPNAYVGDLVPNGKGWTVVGPAYCPNWHSIDEPDMPLRQERLCGPSSAMGARS
ncbi:hypothetical protein [Mycobacteroides abscessus]|uniref:hypothetical protein n=1 Tax=Mycobacteroides abscessus TaxID=36809 RepID=UPI002105F631|nr:hypothetical protein [Mycobacteroides abscessus]